MTISIKLIFQVSIVLVLPIKLLFFLFDIGFDLRSNLFEKKNDDAYQPTNTIKDQLHVPIGLITRSKRKTLK